MIFAESFNQRWQRHTIGIGAFQRRFSEFWLVQPNVGGIV
jgi:hypothetical protein